MTAQELKEYLNSDSKRIVMLLESLGCHGIKEYSKDFRCGLPNKHNTTAVSLFKDSLSTRVFLSDKESIRGDIFTLIMYIKELDFPKSVRYIHDLFKIEYKFYNNNYNKPNDDNKCNVLGLYKNIRKNKKIKQDNEEIIPLDVDLQKYDDVYHIDFIKDNISPLIMKKMQIKYSFDNRRVIIPHKYWLTDEVCGIFGRTTIKNFEELNIPKYYGINPYKKSKNLYGLSDNYKSIKEKGYVVVCEGEKSVLQAMTFGEYNVVAVGSHELSKEQVNILLSLDVDIIIGFDEGISIEHIKYTCAQFRGTRNVYYIQDQDLIMGEKDSPTDNGREAYYTLLKHKIKYNYKPNDFIEYLVKFKDFTKQDGKLKKNKIEKLKRE